MKKAGKGTKIKYLQIKNKVRQEWKKRRKEDIGRNGINKGQQREGREEERTWRMKESVLYKRFISLYLETKILLVIAIISGTVYGLAKIWHSERSRQTCSNIKNKNKISHFFTWHGIFATDKSGINSLYGQLTELSVWSKDCSLLQTLKQFSVINSSYVLHIIGNQWMKRKSGLIWMSVELHFLAVAEKHTQQAPRQWARSDNLRQTAKASGGCDLFLNNLASRHTAAI